MRTANEIYGAVCLIGLIASAGAADGKAPYPNMAPIEQYRIASRTEEIALARSAAPSAISNDADVMVLGDRGYETAVKGKNGFVCLVLRSWTASFDDPQFWNPRIRGPNCYNPAAVSTVLPVDLQKTQWVLSGVSMAEMAARGKTLNSVPAPGAIGYMMSKHQQLPGSNEHWHPHVMFFEPHIATAASGADLPGSPVLSSGGSADEFTVFYVPVGEWSDGTPAMEMKGHCSTLSSVL